MEDAARSAVQRDEAHQGVPRVRLQGISKYFPENGVEALARADFAVYPGEIHALAGENGAGKSTLLAILAGSLSPSAGTLEVDGRRVAFKGPADALKAGIGLLRQHPALVPGLKVWEDCILGFEPLRAALPFPGIIRTEEARRELGELSRTWGLNIDPDEGVDKLALSQRQKAVLLSLLYRGASILALDEPTAALTPAETRSLFSVLRSLRERGTAIILVTHKLDEVLSLADRITVLRKGTSVATLSSTEADSTILSRLMFGTQTGGEPDTTAMQRHRDNNLQDEEDSPITLSVEGLTVGPQEYARKSLVRNPLYDVSFSVRRGHIVGVAGVRESGMETLELALSGLIPTEGGSVVVNGQPIGSGDPGSFRNAGGSYLPADRLGLALAPHRPLEDSLDVYRRLGKTRTEGRGWWINRRASFARASAILARAGIRGDPRATASGFSGGTLQRALLEREFSQRPSLFILSEPTWGLDAEGAKRLKTRLLRFVKEGGSAVLLSADIDDLLDLSDEIVVLRGGRIVDRLEARNASATQKSRDKLRDRIGDAMTGAEGHDAQ